jgi:hypothetical protein
MQKALMEMNIQLANVIGDLSGVARQLIVWASIPMTMRLSHETIYRSLFIQARGVLKKETDGHLRSERRMRCSRHATVCGQSRGQIVDIRERPPPRVEHRAIPGHCEGDLLSGAKNSYIATLVERHSRFAMPIKVPSLNPKLPQMMIQMLVHQDRPLLRRQRPEEAVRMCGTALGPGGYKPVDQTVQTRAFLCQVPLILNNQTFHSRRIAAQRFVVPKHVWLDDGAHDPSEQYPWRPKVP